MARRSIVVAVVLVLAVATVTPAASAASDDESFFDGLIDSEGDDGEADFSTELRQAVLKAINFDRVVAKYTTEPENATTYADEFQAEFNQNNESIEAYANERLNASTEYDVIAIYFHDRSGGNATRYLVANVSNGNYTNARIVSPDRFDDLNRTVDHQISADWYVSERADTVLAAFVEQYVETGEDVPWTYRTTMVAKYGSGVSGSLWGTLNGSESDG